MASHHQPANDAARMNTHEMFGISLAVLPEPEVLQADLAHIHCKSLAKIITDLLNSHEPLLVAECDGSNVTVRERGGSWVGRFMVQSIERDK